MQFLKTSRVLIPSHRRLQRNAFRSLGYSANGPSPTQTTWERAAVRVKNTDTEKNNPYLDLIRDTHDPSLHLKTIEDELQGSIGKALGKQGQKILMFTKMMNQEYQRYEALLAQTGSSNLHTIKDELHNIAVKFNDHRKSAIQARWELMVHRQAAGFIVNNHKHVTEHYPIADALPTEFDVDHANETSNDKVDESSKKQFGDQLDWWQRIGRWK